MRIDLNKHWIINQPIAHRGLHNCNDKIPENSIAAFQKAIEKNFAIEFDVQLSRDNEIVVFHDYDLKRMCGINKKVNEFSLTQLKDLYLKNTKEKIPTLKEVLDLANNKVPLLIEIKNEGKPTLLEKKLNDLLSTYSGNYAIQSFNPMSLYWFYKNNPQVLRGQLSSKFKNIKMNFFIKYLLSNLYFNIFSHPDFIAYNIDDLPNKKLNKSQKKIPVLGWTIDTIEKYQKSLIYCDNIIFECLNIEKL